MNGKCKGITRRSFLVDTGMGFTGLALGAMLFKEGAAQADSSTSSLHPLIPSPPHPRMEPARAPHFGPKAKSVIWIFLCGGVSHLESFDVKPELNKYAGKSVDETPYKSLFDPAKLQANIVGGNPAHVNRKVLMPLQTGYKTYGQSGLVVGDWFKHIGECADELAVVR